MRHLADSTNAPRNHDQGDFVRAIWRQLSDWIHSNTFVPSWAPARLRHPLIGYLGAVVLAGVAVGLTVLLSASITGFTSFSPLLLLAVVLVALIWGVGPSLVATVVGSALISYLFYSPRFTVSINSLDEAVSFVLILVIGIIVSTLTGRVAWARLQADQARHEADAHATQLHTALAALEEARGRLDTFLGVTGHELKSPLTALKLNLQLTKRRIQQAEPAPDPAALVEPLRAFFLATQKQVERLERMVQDLVDISRIQAGKLELRRTWVDLVTLVHETVEGQRQAVPDRCITFQAPPEVPVLVYADPGRLEQVVTNYLTNALKYAPAERPIDVGVQVEQQLGRVWVRDEGPGLTLEEQQRIWEPFHRVQGIEALPGIGVGLGLGLHICRLIIEQHDGQAGVESTPGVGSTFWFTVPVGSPSEAER